MAGVRKARTSGTGATCSGTHRLLGDLEPIGQCSAINCLPRKRVLGLVLCDDHGEGYAVQVIRLQRFSVEVDLVDEGQEWTRAPGRTQVESRVFVPERVWGQWQRRQERELEIGARGNQARDLGRRATIGMVPIHIGGQLRGRQSQVGEQGRRKERGAGPMPLVITVPEPRRQSRTTPSCESGRRPLRTCLCRPKQLVRLKVTVSGPWRADRCEWYLLGP